MRGRGPVADGVPISSSVAVDGTFGRRGNRRDAIVSTWTTDRRQTGVLLSSPVAVGGDSFRVARIPTGGVPRGGNRAGHAVGAIIW
jgi:hypothetical protein